MFMAHNCNCLYFLYTIPRQYLYSNELISLYYIVLLTIVVFTLYLIVVILFVIGLLLGRNKPSYIHQCGSIIIRT